MFHCVKSVHIWSFSDPYFPAFELNTERYSVFLRLQSECGKIRTRETPNTDTFYAVFTIETKKQKNNSKTKTGLSFPYFVHML